jgi:hypothetical protein
MMDQILRWTQFCVLWSKWEEARKRRQTGRPFSQRERSWMFLRKKKAAIAIVRVGQQIKEVNWDQIMQGCRSHMTRWQREEF